MYSCLYEQAQIPKLFGFKSNLLIIAKDLKYQDLLHLYLCFIFPISRKRKWKSKKLDLAKDSELKMAERVFDKIF